MYVFGVWGEISSSEPKPAPQDLVPVFTDSEVGQWLGQEQAPGRSHEGPAPREHNDQVSR